ncbi:hypothetical protein, partial [Acetobacter tropicalis]
GATTRATVAINSGGSLIVDSGAQQYTPGSYILNGGTIVAHKDLASFTTTNNGGNIILDGSQGAFTLVYSSALVAGKTNITVENGAALS